MKVMIFLIPLAIAMAFTIAILTTQRVEKIENTKEKLSIPSPLIKRKVSRFLVEQKPRNPKAADHCHKEHEICQAFEVEGGNATCCNNKCVDLKYDDHNCGTCKKKCRFTETCCRGECVNLSFDKRHCGYCNNRCMTGGYCFYGMCDYA
ncbi:stigma-specific STIG1-like protein 2 [Nicotiana tomentosiformis]|uniref:stigma-specific STIG1-like protein 2 n=1 Tax=Nicotiana tomentosiformis TaxID=4098 RepID=UPI00051B0BAA|nr:stigma-specific STIG1-like protein 2 [Nicotiana tomentosiformis]